MAVLIRVREGQGAVVHGAELMTGGSVFEFGLGDILVL